MQGDCCEGTEASTRSNAVRICRISFAVFNRTVSSKSDFEADTMNLYSLAKQFPLEEFALDHLIKVRWPSGVRCVACDHDKCWSVESKGKTGKPRRVFQCA